MFTFWHDLCDFNYILCQVKVCLFVCFLFFNEKTYTQIDIFWNLYISTKIPGKGDAYGYWIGVVRLCSRLSPYCLGDSNPVPGIEHGRWSCLLGSVFAQDGSLLHLNPIPSNHSFVHNWMSFLPILDLTPYQSRFFVSESKNRAINKSAFFEEGWLNTYTA